MRQPRWSRTEFLIAIALFTVGPVAGTGVLDVLRIGVFFFIAFGTAGRQLDARLLSRPPRNRRAHGSI